VVVVDVDPERERADTEIGLPAGDAPPLTLTTTADVADDALAAALRAHGYAVARRLFLRDTRDDDGRRVVLVAWDDALPPLVALMDPATAPPGVVTGLIAALYPTNPTVVATVQLKAAGAFASVTAEAPALLEALTALAARVRSASESRWAWPPAERERRIAYVGGAWYTE